jgi:DNA recombination protein RmuC
MAAGSIEVLLLSVTAIGGSIAAAFSILGFYRAGRQGSLTSEIAGSLLRSETDIVRGAIHDQARWLRQELGQSLISFQETMLSTFGTLRDGIDSQVRNFGERLDGGIKAIDDRAAAIGIKLTNDTAAMRAEASANRENLRTAIDQKLDLNIVHQADALKNLRDELSGNFDRLGSRVANSLTELSQLQKERLENVTGALMRSSFQPTVSRPCCPSIPSFHAKTTSICKKRLRPVTVS